MYVEKVLQKIRFNHPLTGATEGLSTVAPIVDFVSIFEGLGNFLTNFFRDKKSVKTGDYLGGLFGDYLGVI